MTDTKKIIVTGATYTGQANIPNITSNGPVNSEIVSGISSSVPSVANSSDLLLDVQVTGLGEENIPDPRLFKFLSDKFKLQEQVLRDVYKSLSDLTTTPEQVRKLLEKTLSDVATNNDVFDRVWIAYRSFLDSTSNTELVEKSFEKVLLDLVNTQDLLTSDVAKYLQDVIALANLSYAVILVNKFLQHQTVGFTDTLSRIVQFNRTFEDTIFITDDFYGLANIDDDQFVDAYKVILTWANTLETFAVDVTKPDLVDQATASEQKYLYSQIPKSDQVVNSDLQTSLVGLNKLDQAVTNEQQIFNVNKPDRTDQVITSDEKAAAVSKPAITDQFAVSDLLTKLVNQISLEVASLQNELYNFTVIKPDLQDTGLILDEIAKSFSTSTINDQTSNSDAADRLIGINIEEIDYFLEDYNVDTINYTFRAVHASDQITQTVLTKLLQNVVDATDDFYGLANLDDDQTASINKVVVDYAAVAENFSRLVSYIRQFVNIASISEQIELNTVKVLFNQITNLELILLSTNKVVNDLASTLEIKLFEVTSQQQHQVTSLEQAELTLEIPKTDAIVSQDLFTRLYQAVRIFTEQTQTTELVEQLISKISSDQTMFIELVEKTSSKILSNQLNTSEQLSFNFELVHLELIDATDDFYGLANIDDDQIASFDKLLSHHVSSIETITTVAQFYRTFIETAYATDLATFNFAKSILDTITTSELFEVLVTTSKLDVATVVETIINSISKPQTDSVTQADLFSISIEPNKYETVSTLENNLYNTELVKLETVNSLETVNKDFVTPRTDSASILEDIIKEWTIIRANTDNIVQSDEFKPSLDKLVLETSLLTELITKVIAKQLNNTSTTIETISKNITTELQDLIDATDDFYGLANIDDDQFASFQKSLNNYVSNSDVITTLVSFLRSVDETQILSEVFAVVTNKALSDISNSSDTVVLLAAPSKLETVATSQTISLTLQSYFSEDYVELGYVGETYTY